MAGVPVNHVGVCPADMERSLRFYVDGVGLEVLFDVELAADLEGLLGVATTKVRTVFLGSTASRDVGALELIDMGNGPIGDQPPGSGTPQRGAFLVSFHVPVRAALDRLAALDLGGPPRVVPTPSGGIAATVVDPDGIVVELLDQPVSLG